MAELKYTKHLLGKIEDIFKEIEYTIRYAKGSFQSGYCLVEQQKVVVVNKYYETEGRINVLIDILDNLTIEESTLTEKCLKTYKQVMKKKQEETEEVSEESLENADDSKEASENTPENADDSKEVSEDTPENVDDSKEDDSKKVEDIKEETVEQNGEADEL